VARIGLVLGAGGVTGSAFHAGVLAALAEGIGWDPRRSETIVGTSAGSVTAAMLRAGFNASDLAARAEGKPVSPEGHRLLSGAGVPANWMSMPTAPGRRRDGWPRPAAPGALLAAARRPWGIRPSAMAAALMPEGTVPTASIADGIDHFFPKGWPSFALWVCAMRLDSGSLMVFGKQDAGTVRVGQAVAASCAIPGYFAPVSVGGERYVDGGAFSLTNLSLMAGLGLDLVVVSAPMAKAGRAINLAGGLAREAGRAQLDREALWVKRGGTPVVAFAPTADDQRVMGLNAMDPRRRAATARQVRASTHERLSYPGFVSRLEPLTD
jgi:NTE family protein